MHVSEMLETNPTRPTLQADRLARCIEACFDCAQTCTACADACLGEQDIDPLRTCIRLDLDCTDVCLTTGRMLSRQHHVDARLFHAQLEACLAACEVCGDECAKHAEHYEHCRVCAEACRDCARACRDALDSLRSATPRAASA